MKTLKDKILEAKQSIYGEISWCTEGWIDYMYNEGVIDYNDRHLVDYSKGKIVPNYTEIAQGILDEYIKNLSNETQNIVKQYIQDGKDKKVEKAILDAIKKFAKDGNCELWI